MSDTFSRKIKGLIIDMDGVLWLDNKSVGDLPSIFKEIKKRNWQVTLATNNATRTPQQYLRKLAEFGVYLETKQIINSSIAAAHYLKSRFPDGGNVYIVGENALIETIIDAGFEIDSQNPIAVIVSFDRNLTYEKLMVATLLIRSGVPFIATNTDRTYPTPAGLIPGAGAIVASVATATDIQPVVMGKPSPEMYQIALDRMRLDPDSTLVIGDRIETDIAGAQKIGCQTALVLSGVTSREAAASWIPQPNWIAPDLSTLLEMLPEA